MVEQSDDSGDHPGTVWQRLCEEWHAKHQAVLSFPLFEGRRMQTDRLGEMERLRSAEQEVRDRIDAFIAANQ